tara:strand:+ start:413 stop:610 length:198 start_codon:yes stop_codon:yes gene_type:complete
MKFAFIPKEQYSIDQIIKVHGEKMRVESISTISNKLYAVSLKESPTFKRILCICTNEQPIAEVTA